MIIILNNRVCIVSYYLANILPRIELYKRVLFTIMLPFIMNRQFFCVAPYGDYTIRDGIVYYFFKNKIEISYVPIVNLLFLLGFRFVFKSLFFSFFHGKFFSCFYFGFWINNNNGRRISNFSECFIVVRVL